MSKKKLTDKEQLHQDQHKCSRCNIEKSALSFNSNFKRNRKQVWCKSCCSEVNKLNYSPEKKRIWALKYRYDVEVDYIEDLKFKQNNCCAVCGRSREEFKKNLHIDHCHRTGKIRGLLCARCNTALSVIEDKDLMEKLNAYLH